MLPGASAVLLAVVASGLPSHAFSFRGYLPNRGEPRRTLLKLLGAEEETIVVFETPHRIHETLADLEELLPDREIALGRELTKLHETWYRGTPAQVKAQLGREDRGEMVLVLAGAGAKRVVTEAATDFDGAELPPWAKAYLAAAREGGMTLREAEAEVRATIELCAFFSTETQRDQDRVFRSGVRAHLRPVGVCGILATGSSPLAAPARRILPAILCGTTVVWKPSDNAPTVAYLLLRAMMEAGLPSGVVNTVNGRGKTGCGKHLLAAIDKGHFQAFSFVGSEELGRIVGVVCGRNLILPSLDLARKGAMVVLPDADLDLAVEDALRSAFTQGGQASNGLSNLLLHEACAAGFRKQFMDRVARLEVGNPLTDPEVTYGPMINARSATSFSAHWESGRAEGATLLTGGEQWTEANRTSQVKGHIGHGLYMQPCVWEGVKPDMALFRNQVAGPSVNLATFASFDEALAWIHGAPCGTIASLYTQDRASIQQFTRELRADVATVNRPADAAEARLPFAGQGTHPGARPTADGFLRWQTHCEAAFADLPPEQPIVPGPALSTDWDSL